MYIGAGVSPESALVCLLNHLCCSMSGVEIVCMYVSSCIIWLAILCCILFPLLHKVMLIGVVFVSSSSVSWV